ncbi:unnamed protein product [Sphagnum troendelagicum]
MGGTCCYELLLCLPGRTQENHWQEDPGIMRMESSRMLESKMGSVREALWRWNRRQSLWESTELLSADTFPENSKASKWQWRNFNKYVLVCTILASLNSILLGYDTSVSSGDILFIKLGIKEVQEEVLVGFLSIVSLLGAVASGWIADAVG